ncbi:hypothetical protein EPUS_06852 [Endocarpon pusillum Z07020]|uniref:Uncharacterized protein n=1 Tax=Endocarpon pusillum (strain Z07020 / HMAS-L-300199) TaxID=1263415 RepID=U1I4E5_ENDPU|nr:uncharacterized protein EPUS_06852 [Endocarpon pusillum Z07020]ERF76984.1 hypothetical protein EPUS_06852 [Endocarpon pusillum Z07020]
MTSFSPFLITAYTSLLTTSLQKAQDLSSFLCAQKLHGRSRVDATITKIDKVTAQQANVGTDVPASKYEDLQKQRLSLGQSVAGMAMMDAAFDNYIFDVTLLSKKIEDAKGQLEAFDTPSAKKRKRTNGTTVNLGGVGKPSRASDKGSSEKWCALMETVQQVVAETGSLASAIEGTVRVEDDDDNLGRTSGAEEEEVDDGTSTSSDGETVELKRKASEELTAPEDIAAEQHEYEAKLRDAWLNNPTWKLTKSIHDFTWGEEPAEKAYEEVAAFLNRIFRDLSQLQVTVDMLKAAKRKSLLYIGLFPFWDMAALSGWRSQLLIEPFLLWKILSEKQPPTDAYYILILEEVRASAKKVLATKSGVRTTNRVETNAQVGATDDSGVTGSTNTLGSGSANMKAKDARAMRDDVLLAAEDLIQKSTGLPPELATVFRNLGEAFRKYTESLE